MERRDAMNSQTIDSEKLLRQVLQNIALLPPNDLLLVYEVIHDLQKKPKLNADEILERAKARATEIHSLSHAESVQRFIDSTDKIRANAIQRGVAIEGEWESD
jgi:hypothetical protein